MPLTPIKRFSEIQRYNFIGSMFVHDGSILFTIGRRALHNNLCKLLCKIPSRCHQDPSKIPQNPPTFPLPPPQDPLTTPSKSPHHPPLPAPPPV